jgi:hypothetical protein
MDNKEKTLSPSDLRNAAQQLIRNGQMPSPDDFAEAMGATKKDYEPKLAKIREQEKA